MRVEVSADIPATVEAVFDFLADPANALKLSEHAADHAVGLEMGDATPDGRRTFDIRMRAGDRAWVQTIQQLVRERPSRLVTRGWTWTDSRDDPVMEVTTDRRLAPTPSGTRIEMAVDYQVRKASLVDRVRFRLQREAARLEIVNGVHLLIDHFQSLDASAH